MNIQQIENRLVGESIPLQFSFLSDLMSFNGQTLTGASIAWNSQDVSLATFDAGSEALVTSDNAAAKGVSNDACLGRFTLVAPGVVTCVVTVDAVNPVATYIGLIQIQIEGIPVP